MTSADFVRNVLPWFMSAITLYMTFLQGRKTWYAWLVGLANQVLWLWFALSTQTWGFLPLNAGLWYLYVRNLLLWYDDEKRLQLLRDELAAANYKAPKPRWQDSDGRFYETTDELKHTHVDQ